MHKSENINKQKLNKPFYHQSVPKTNFPAWTYPEIEKEKRKWKVEWEKHINDFTWLGVTSNLLLIKCENIRALYVCVRRYISSTLNGQVMVH